MKVGVVLIIEGNDELGMPRYSEVRNLALHAERSGIDSLWLYDHLLFRNGESVIGHWECFTILSALAECTERIELGTLVACTAFRNPAVLAKIATTLDEISNGRFTLGLGAGWNEVEFDAFGFPYDHRVDRFVEAMEVIAPLVRNGKVDFVGQYARAANCEDLPRGPRPNGPPIMIGAFGTRMQRIAARYADMLNSFFPSDDATERWHEIESICAEVGRDPATFAISRTYRVAFPQLGRVPDDSENVLHSADELAAVIGAFERNGADHLMIDFRPNTVATLDVVAAGVRRWRANR